jgi:large subunit ribosomal protein L18
MKIDKKRRLERRTDYKKRLRLLKGGFLRAVIRKTNRYIILQIVDSDRASDKVLFSVNTKELKKIGWPEEKSGSLKSLSAAYLGGFLLGKKSKSLKKEIILDSGLSPNTKGSRIYAAVKGLADSGVKIKCNKDVFPELDKIEKPIGAEKLNKIKGGIK